MKVYLLSPFLLGLTLTRLLLNKANSHFVQRDVHTWQKPTNNTDDRADAFILFAYWFYFVSYYQDTQCVHDNVTFISIDRLGVKFGVAFSRRKMSVLETIHAHAATRVSMNLHRQWFFPFCNRAKKNWRWTAHVQNSGTHMPTVLVS